MSSNHQLQHTETHAKELDKGLNPVVFLSFYFATQATMINNYYTSLLKELLEGQ